MRCLVWACCLSALAACSSITSVDDLEFREADTGRDTMTDSGDTNDGGGVGDLCDQASDCMSGFDCPRLVDGFSGQGSEIESYCYPSCAADAGVCAGTGMPKCFASSVCLGTLAASGSIVCKSKGSIAVEETSVTLVIGTESSPTTFKNCDLRKGSGNGVVATMIAAVQGKRRQLVLSGVPSTIGESQNFEGFVYDVLLDNQDAVQDVWLVGFFDSVTLDAKFASDVLRGSIDIEGYAYSAKLDPAVLP